MNMLNKDNDHEPDCVCSECIALHRRSEHTSLVGFCLMLGVGAVLVAYLLAIFWRMVFRT